MMNNGDTMTDVDMYEVELLCSIGSNPMLGIDDLSDILGKTRSYVRHKINDFRKRSLVIKTSYEKDVERGLKWELTGKGKSYIEDEAHKLSNVPSLNVSVDDVLHVYVPLSNRKNVDV